MEQNEQELVTPGGSFDLDVQPYMFEPVETVEHSVLEDESGNSDCSDSDEQQDISQNRMLNTDWCDCGQCRIMDKHIECICCIEVEDVDHRRGKLQCITEHEGFKANCLNRDVLEVSLYEYVEYEGPLDDNEPIHETYRYVAYRRYVRWIWHRLGKHIRKVLPACVVSKIRKEFPSQDDQYTGFKYAVP